MRAQLCSREMPSKAGLSRSPPPLLIDQDVYAVFLINADRGETRLEQRSRTSKEPSNYGLSDDTAAFSKQSYRVCPTLPPTHIPPLLFLSLSSFPFFIFHHVFREEQTRRPHFFWNPSRRTPTHTHSSVLSHQVYLTTCDKPNPSSTEA